MIMDALSKGLIDNVFLYFTAGASSKRLHKLPSPAAPSALCALHLALPAPQLRATMGPVVLLGRYGSAEVRAE